MAVILAVLLCMLLQVNDLSAQSCVISPNISPNIMSLAIRDGLVRNIEFHCQCIAANGMMINGMWFRGTSNTALSTGDSTSTTPYQINNTTRNILFINSPFTSSFAATYYCSPNNVRDNSNGDNITLSTGSTSGSIVCTIYSPSSTTNGVLMYIPNGAQNVILYCICRGGNLAIGPTVWSHNNTALLTQVNGNNAYYRNNVPAPLIIPQFAAATHSGSYACRNPIAGPEQTINLASSDCVISPTLTTLTIIENLVRNVELHCQCMNSDGMVITGARWFYNGTIVPVRATTVNTSRAIYQTNSIARNILFINQPFTGSSHAGTYTCSPNNVLYSTTSGSDEINLNFSSAFGSRTCAIYSTSLASMTVTSGSITSGRIVSGATNVILYCICRINDVAADPVTWFVGNQMVGSNGGSDNPYTRDNVPTPLIFSSFTTTEEGTYQCRSNTVTATIVLSLFAPVDSPTNVMVSMITPRSVRVTWTAPSSLSEVTGYLISYTTIASYASNGTVMVSDSSNTSGTIHNLEEGTTYTITVQSNIDEGLSDKSNAEMVTTQAVAPSSPPQNVMVTSADPASLIVSWQPPPPINHNGPITGYVIQYTMVGSSDTMSVNVTSGSTPTVLELRVLTNYSVTVAATNAIGTGPFSDPVVNISGGDRPSAPQLLDLVSVNSSSVILQWQLPATPNGVIILYSLKYNSTTPIVTNTSSDVLMYTVGGLSSENVYIFQVTAHTRAGEGPPINLTVVIPPRPISNVTIPYDSISPSTLTLTWMGISLVNSVLIHYTVFYSPVSGPYDRIMTSSRRKRQSAQPLELTMDFTSGTIGTLMGLNGSVTYMIQVAAVVMLNGQVVTGDRSTATEVTTEVGIPTPPRNLNASVTNNDVRLTWSRPDPPNGLITQYSVSYVNTNPNTLDSNTTIIPGVIDGDALSFAWTGLSRGTYNFIVVASTAVGPGEAANVIQSIAIGTNCDDSSDDNCGVNIALATLLAIALIVLVVSVVINVLLIIQRKQSRYAVSQNKVRYSDVKQSGSTDYAITQSTNKHIKPSEPEYEAVEPCSDVKMDANPAYQATT